MKLHAVPVLALFSGLLVYAAADLPEHGRADAPASVHVAARYVERSLDDAKTPNVVTTILADYRGYDTLGEAFVVFTAALACIAILTPPRPRPAQPLGPPGPADAAAGPPPEALAAAEVLAEAGEEGAPGERAHALPDATLDEPAAGSEAVPEAPPGAVADAPPEALPDAAPDAGPDARSEPLPDAAAESGPPPSGEPQGGGAP